MIVQYYHVHLHVVSRILFLHLLVELVSLARMAYLPGVTTKNTACLDAGLINADYVSLIIILES